MKSKRNAVDRYRLKKDEIENLIQFRQTRDQKRVLIVGDLHAPFSLAGYREFCESIYKKYNCNEVVFIGDLIDNHYSSYHETDPDGHSARQELDLAIAEVKKWYELFPVAKVCLGNHDNIASRRAMSSGLSKTWIKSISEVLNTPNWEYAEEFIINGNLYTHGVGRKAKQRCKSDFVNVIQGHYHSESYIEHYVGIDYRLFAMQLGCGIDKKSYAMAYGRNFNKPHICCGVVLENGRLPILEHMDL